jgi:RHS repeat-associated protein
MEIANPVLRHPKSSLSGSRFPAPILWLMLTLPSPFNVFPAQTTVYVNKYFEVRDQDQPTKYVFKGETRVARLTGSLSANTRVQRVRLDAGWNLRSLAVTAPDALHQLTNSQSSTLNSQSCFQWNSSSLSWLPILPDETLLAGTILWLHATTNNTLALTGTYTDPTNRIVASGGSLQPGAGLESLILPGPGADIALWHHDGANQGWQIQVPSVPGLEPGFPRFLAPGEVIFMNAGVPAELDIQEAALRICYYHQDHLGSSSVTTDAQGALVEETAFYPFGVERQAHRSRQIEEDYKFSQKERDKESGLHYFEARYLLPALARFISADPLKVPEARNPYAYAAGNPMRYLDPSGLDPVEGGDASASVKVGASYSDSGTSTTDWFEPIKTEYQFNIAGDVGAETSLRGIFQGKYAELKGMAEGKYSYNTAHDSLWTLSVPFSVSARGTVGSGGLSYSGTVSARYSLFARLPMGAISMSYQGKGSSVPEYTWRQGGVGFYPKINPVESLVPPPETAFNAPTMSWSQGVGLTARYVKQFKTSRLELAGGMGIGLNENNVPQLTYPFARATYSWGQTRGWRRMPSELAAAAGVP